MHVGQDTVTVGCYVPGTKREDVAIYTGPSWQPWHPLDIETKGLGGSETAAVRLAHELSELGWIVTVYGDHPEGCARREVIYRHHSTFDPLESRHLLISSRMPEVFDRPVRAKHTALWVHDTDVQDRLTDRRARRIDHILCLSEWHERHLAGLYPSQAKKLVRVRNGIHHDWFLPKPWEERAKRVLYTSSPDRGLDVLLERIWPKVIEEVPDAELGCCYADVYDRVAQLDANVGRFRDRVNELADQPGVRRLGSLSQPKLAALMSSSRVWAHPSWASMHDGPFHETSCVGAMEAQAAGCLVVASGWGALPETVKHGRLVNSGPLSDRWCEAFARHIIDGLTNPEVGQRALEKGPPAVADLDWAGVARSVAALVEEPVKAEAA